jgi:hypothetical protein
MIGIMNSPLSNLLLKPEPRLNLDSVIAANKKLNFIQRAMDAKTPSVMIQGQNAPSTHFMESSDGIVYPTVVQTPDGGIRFMGKYLGNNKEGGPMYNTDEAYKYAKSTGNYIKFNNDADAQYFSENYKKSKLVKIGKK